jgi:hypothetical protein
MSTFKESMLPIVNKEKSFSTKLGCFSLGNETMLVISNTSQKKAMKLKSDILVFFYNFLEMFPSADVYYINIVSRHGVNTQHEKYHQGAFAADVKV